MTQEDQERYRRAQHAMQTGVAMMMEIYQHDLTQKSFRVGINTALCDASALVKLLIKKGIISTDEIEKALADEMEAEAERYRERINRYTGADVKLV